MKATEANSGIKKRRQSRLSSQQRTTLEAPAPQGVDLSTLKRWLRLPEFQAEFLQARREILSQTNARIQCNSGALASLGFKLAADPRRRLR